MCKSVTITGANSFIGKKLVHYFLQSNYKVYVVSRGKCGNMDKCTIINTELSLYKYLDTIIPHTDIFINLAWNGTGHEDRNNDELQSHNVEFTVDAIYAAKRMGCKIFIQAGSQAEYGFTTNLTDENADCHPFSEYGIAKLKVKEKGFLLCKELGMTYIHLRIFSLFGEMDHPWTLIMSSIDKMLHDEDVLLSMCEQNWNFMYVDDAALSIVKLCDSYENSPVPTQEIYNLASRDTRPLKDFVEQIKLLTKSHSILKYGEISYRPVVSLQPDISKLENRIGQVPFTSFNNVINKIINIKTRLHDKSV